MMLIKALILSLCFLMTLLSAADANHTQKGVLSPVITKKMRQTYDKARAEYLKTHGPPRQREIREYPPWHARKAVVCGANTAKRSSFNGVCQLRMFAQNFDEFFCSGWLIGRNLIATAGHCLFDKQARWMREVRVFCGAGNGQVSARTWSAEAVQFVTTAEFFKFVRGKPSNRGKTMWADAAIVRVDRQVPTGFKPYAFRQISCKGSLSATVSGYPATGTRQCRQFQATPNRQWSSTGKLNCREDRKGFLPAATDTCSGHSGSRALIKGNIVVGIHTGGLALASGCSNSVVRIKDGGDGRGRGVFLRPLMKMLQPRRRRVRRARRNAA